MPSIDSQVERGCVAMKDVGPPTPVLANSVLHSIENFSITKSSTFMCLL